MISGNLVALYAAVFLVGGYPPSLISCNPDPAGATSIPTLHIATLPDLGYDPGRCVLHLAQPTHEPRERRRRGGHLPG